MKTFTISIALVIIGITSFSQNICPSSFKRNNGNGTCNSLGELRLNFAPVCPENAPFIDSVYVDGVKTDVTFNSPDMGHCGGNNGYISYCVASGNMPPANVWLIYFHVGGTSYDCTVGSGTGVLSVKYLSFDAAVSGSTITCTWTTEEEINNNYFELERSFDGINFSNIAIIFNAENSIVAKQNYKYKDNETALKNKQVVYYRLKQVNKDGSASYSKLLTVKLNATYTTSLQVSPNPFTESLITKVYASERGYATTKVIGVTGQVLISTQTNVSKGSNNLQITNLDGLAKGIYVIQVSINGVIEGTQKIIKN